MPLHVSLSLCGAWAAVSSSTGTLHRIDVVSFAVVHPPLCIGSVGSGGSTALSIVSEDVVVCGDAAGMLTAVHLKAEHEVGQQPVTSAAAFCSGAATNMQGPGGQPAAPGGILELGPCFVEAGGVVDTQATAAGTIHEEDARNMRQVRSVNLAKSYMLRQGCG